MKVIDLLNKIANGEEVPKKIEFNTLTWRYCYDVNDYSDLECYLFRDYMDEIDNNAEFLNEEVEILEEEKKIPEKLDGFTISVGRVDDSNIEEYIQTLFEQSYEVFNKINSIIDYLKSKGE